MKKYSWLAFAKLATASVPLLALRARPAEPPATIVNGVRFGVETFSFHDLPPAGDPN